MLWAIGKDCTKLKCAYNPIRFGFVLVGYFSPSGCSQQIMHTIKDARYEEDRWEILLVFR